MNYHDLPASEDISLDSELLCEVYSGGRNTSGLLRLGHRLLLLQRFYCIRQGVLLVLLALLYLSCFLRGVQRLY